MLGREKGGQDGRQRTRCFMLAFKYSFNKQSNLSICLPGVEIHQGEGSQGPQGPLKMTFPSAHMLPGCSEEQPSRRRVFHALQTRIQAQRGWEAAPAGIFT